MIAHVILFSPKDDLSPDARRLLLEALVAASAGIPSIRKFRVGRRIKHGLPGYEQMMADDYEYGAIIEFDDVEGLKAYLVHPSHAAVGRHFSASASRSLAYDYAIVDASDAQQLP
ncbi:MAG: Dabb family protein [Acidobacteriota bacterium]